MKTMIELLATDTAKMERAWDLVSPRARALRLAAKGELPQVVAESVSWKGRIAALVSDQDLAAASVTIEDVRQAVIFFTGTVPTTESVALAEGAGYLVQAVGYLMGPCGP